MNLKDTDKLVELIDDDIASLDKNTSRLIDADQLIEFIDAYITILDERYKKRVSQTAFDVCLCTLQMVKQYIKALPTVPLDWKSILDDWTEHDNAMIAKGREIERRLNAPKHGRWLPSDKGDCTYTCSECGFVRDAYILEENAYCPRCGAKMDKKDTDVPDKNVGKMDEVNNG